MQKVFYEYSCCEKKWEERVKFTLRDRVRCGDCGKHANRLVSSFNFTGGTYVGTKRFKGAELATGVQSLESTGDVDRALEATGTQPVDAYYRAPKPPPPKEITLEELNEYL